MRSSLFLWVQITYNDVVLFAARFPLRTLQDGPAWEGGIGVLLTTFGSCRGSASQNHGHAHLPAQLLQHNAAPQGCCDTNTTCLAGTSSCTVPQRLLPSWNNKTYHLWQTGCLSELVQGLQLLLAVSGTG